MEFKKDIDGPEEARLLSSSGGLSLPHIFADSNNADQDATINFVGLLVLCSILTLISFYIWKKCLFEKYGAYLPIDQNIDVQ